MVILDELSMDCRWNNIDKGNNADPADRAVYGGGMWPLAVWDYGFEYRRDHGCLSVVSVVCWHVEVSAWGRSLAQSRPTVCSVSECEQETSIMWRPWPSKGCCAMIKKGEENIGTRRKPCPSASSFTTKFTPSNLGYETATNP